jgi:hypothetical protein
MRRLHPAGLLLALHSGVCAAGRSARSPRPGERMAPRRRGPALPIPEGSGR